MLIQNNNIQKTECLSTHLHLPFFLLLLLKQGFKSRIIPIQLFSILRNPTSAPPGITNSDLLELLRSSDQSRDSSTFNGPVLTKRDRNYYVDNLLYLILDS